MIAPDAILNRMAAIHPLDQSTTLERVGPARYAARTSDTYTNFSGPFGGFTAAVLLRAVLDDERCIGTPVALTVNYCAAIADGAFEIAAREIRTGKSTQHWTLELTQGDTVAATASVVCGQRRAVWSHHPSVPPHMPPPEQVPVFTNFRPGGWTSRYEMRFTKGAPDWNPRDERDIRSAHSVLWFVPVGTVTLTTFFHGNEEAMRAQGDAPLLCTADAHLFADGFADQTAHLWGKDGRLLATSTQIVWYKE
jgi:acyl-CoA thioesterase